MTRRILPPSLDGDPEGVDIPPWGRNTGELSGGDEGSLGKTLLTIVARGLQHATEPSGPCLGDWIGDRDILRFELIEELGAGSMGIVFLAKDHVLGRLTAIKFLCGDRLPREFLAVEARATATLNHENIVRVFDIGQWHRLPFLVMEYLEGQSLQALLQRERLGALRTVDILIKVTRGLQHAHSAGIIHRDLKPSNISILRDDNVKILDFGLARATSSLDGRPPAVPLIAGTPSYMAPEQWRGDPQDGRTDIWAAGTMLFEMLTGRLPFEGESCEDLRARLLSDEPAPALRLFRPDLPAEMGRLLERALDKDVNERFQVADGMLGALLELRRALSTSEGGGTTRKSPSVSASDGPPFTPPPWEELWTDAPAPGTVIHRAERRSSLAYWPRALLVFVDDDDPRASRWEGIPERTLLAARVDADTVLHTISADPSNPAWLAREGHKLRELLEGELARYRHVVIIAHEVGAVLVKSMLVDRLAALAGDEHGLRAVDARFSLQRIRQIIRVDEASTDPPSGRAAAAGIDAGAVELCEREFRRWCRRLQEAHLPYPVVHQVPFTRGRSGADPSAALVLRLAALVTREDLVLAREVVAQTFELDCASKIHELIENGPNGAERATPTIALARAGAQAEIFRALLDLTRQSSQRAPFSVVAGDAGVGKSTVLRSLARKLSSDYLEAPGRGAPLCVFIPLYFVSLDDERLRRLDPSGARRNGEALHTLLLDWWCAWFATTTYEGSLRPEWLIERMRSEPTLVIMDGVDEFLTNHPSVGPADVRQMLHFIRTSYAQNPRLGILLGVRGSQPSLSSLTSEDGQVYEILRLTEAQADAFFPAAREWMSGIGDAEVKRLMLTPLLLAYLDSRARWPTPGQITTRAEVLEHILVTIIEQSGLPLLPRAGKGPPEPVHWVHALMLVAWSMFAHLRGEVAVARLREEARATIHAWEQHLARAGDAQQADELLSSFALLGEPQACSALLRRTILYPTGHEGEVRFIHREWQDYLTARYLAESLRRGYVDELGHFAFTLPMFLAAGELLGTLRIEAELVLEVEQRAQAMAEQLIHANFCAVLGNSRTPMSGPAIKMLLGDLGRMPLLSRLVTLASFGARAMNNAPSDVSVSDIRQQLVRSFLALIADESVDCLSRSLAWCNLKALHRTFGTEPPPIAWPALGEREEDEEAALELLCDRTRVPVQVTPRHRSLQLAWVQIQSMIAVSPHRPISTVHYLYTMVVVRRHSVHIPEVSQDLPAVFAEGSPMWLAYQRYTLVPELWTLFLRCRDIFNAS